MTWNKLSKKQQDAARRFSAELTELGVTDATTSQCAKHLDLCFSWKSGALMLAELCEQAGWTPPAPKATETTAQALAAKLGVSLTTIYRRIKAGLLDAIKVNNRWVITLAA